MTEHNRQTISPSSENEPVLSWTVHLAAQDPFKLACSLAATAFVCAAAYWAVGPLGPIAAVMVMLGSLADFLFPVRYEITSTGAACKMFLKSAEMRWENVRRCYLNRDGVKLSPLDRASGLEAFRGVHLRFNGNAERVIEAVRSMRRTSCTESS